MLVETSNDNLINESFQTIENTPCSYLVNQSVQNIEDTSDVGSTATHRQCFICKKYANRK